MNSLSNSSWPGSQRAILLVGVIGIGVLCLLLGAKLPAFITWPDAWTFPVNEWISDGLGTFLNVIKPTARGLSALLDYPMSWAKSLLNALPWPITIGLVVALGWYVGGLAMAALGFFGLMFVLFSGYWHPSMNTLSLVFVSVPLALVVGASIGILANEFPRVKSPVQTVLDIMQTVPTFAYLTPLLFLFGFGPVVGLIASAIYAAPPIARNMILGLERVEPEIREAAIMSGGGRLQQLFLVEIPTASRQIMVGVNQCLMAALSMVIIAAVIGGFNDIGWEVLLTMRKARFGDALLAGLVIVAFAIIIDRISRAFATEKKRFDPRIAGVIVVFAVIVALVLPNVYSDANNINTLGEVADWVDEGLGAYTAEHGQALEQFKNNAMFYGLLPMRIGLDDAVLPFTWGFKWTSTMTYGLYALALLGCIVFALSGRLLAGLALIVFAIVLETGITQLPWPFVLAGFSMLGYFAGGRKLAITICVLLLLIMASGLWERALLSIYLAGTAVFFCACVGSAIGLLCAVSPMSWRIVQPICDMLQTIPLFVFLIPVLMFFQIGEFSAFLAICAYAIVPIIRYTRHGVTSTPDELIEAATASGATTWQIMREIRLPYAAPTILLGLNQTILFAFAMLVIAALIGTTGLGQSIYIALGQADIGLGIAAGAAMAILAFIADRLVQGFAAGKRAALGL